MPQFSNPHVWSNGDTMTAALLNSITQALGNSVNAVDNTQIGTAGIFASQIIPLNAAQGTFGGNIGYTFGPYATTVTPLKVQMAASQSVAGLLISGGTSISGSTLQIDATSGGNHIAQFGTGAAGSTPLLLSGATSQSVNYFEIDATSGGSLGFAVNSKFAVVMAQGSGGSLDSSNFSMAGNSGNGLIGVGSGGSLTFSDHGSATNMARISLAGGIVPSSGSGLGSAAIFSGSGSPSGSLSAPNGSLFMRTDGTHGGTTVLYVNTSGANTTGTTWTAIA